MARNSRKFDEDFRQGAVALVTETGKPIAQVARDLGINQGTLGNWCAKERRSRKKDRSLDLDERAELERLRREVVELRMQRDVLIGLVRMTGLKISDVPAGCWGRERLYRRSGLEPC